MNRTDAMTWVLFLCDDILRRSQAKTLSVLVVSAMRATRLCLADIGREVAAQQDGIAKHAIKRVYRFLANERVEPVDAMPLIVNRFLQKQLKWHCKQPQRRPLLISLDWTKIRSFHTLMAAIVIDGRAIPLCWESYRDKVQGKSQNALEYAMLMRIKAALGSDVRLILLADRGFGRAALIRKCQQLGMDYLIRIKGKVYVESRVYEGVLDRYPIRRGGCHGWHDVSYRSDGIVRTHVLLHWKKGLKGDKDQPWYLATNLPLKNKTQIRKLCENYALRFDIEELFRDAKNPHVGWALGKTQVTTAGRLDRLIFIAALAYLLLTGIGLWCAAHLEPRRWASNNRKKELSAFAIARTMLRKIRLKRTQIIETLIHAFETQSENWG